MRPLTAVVPLLLVLTVNACGDSRSAELAPAPAGEVSSGSPTQPRTWRTEVYHDVQLRVPRTWVLGYAPVVETVGGGGRPMTCGVGPVAGAESGAPSPYVGRPGHGSDVCQVVDVEDLEVGGEGVWFDSPLPVGASTENDLHVRTVDVGSTRVTVATHDGSLGEGILAGVEQVGEDGNGCPSAYEPERRYPDEGFGRAISLSVCVYDSWPDGRLRRTWSTELGAAAARDLVAAAEDASAISCGRATDPLDQVVLLRVRTEDPFGDAPLLRDLAFTGDDCPHVTDVTAGRGAVRLDRGLLEPWAVDGVRAYVSGGAVPMTLADYFRPMMG